MSKVKKAVIPVAGFGTRFLPFTKAVPKPMLPILSVPAVEVIAKEAADSGIEEILFIVGQKKEIIENHFSAFTELEEKLENEKKFDLLETITYQQTFAKVSFVTQKEQRGTADAILAAKKFVKNEPFAVMFGDDVMYNAEKPVIGQLIKAYEKTGKTIVGCKKVPLKDVPKYASCEYSNVEGRLYKMTKITEKPPIELVKSDLAPLGRYVLAPTMMPILENLTPGVNGEYQLTDALDKEAKTNGAYAYDFEGVRYDMGDRLGFLKANVEAGLRDEDLKDGFAAYLKSLVEKL
ncbi:MAG: UTP--glucose-1-phosphate uridylyltransferase [Clostridia bacterium]|nr:UTP--glucose-1-phosphate uridylyltransferase [Clostridia bacterium]